MTKRRRIPIVPSDDGASRSLVAVIAILALLAGLAVGAAAIVGASSAEWSSAIAREATIQVRPLRGRDIEADVGRAVELARATPGVQAARPFSQLEAERLLEPWLGQGLDLSDLPVPRLVVLSLEADPKPDLAALAGRLAAVVPSATLDDHVAWIARLSLVASSVTTGAAAVVLLVLVASGGAVAFATRGAIAGHRELVEVLHFAGAADSFIARAFAWRFARAGLRGGAIGAAVAAALVATGAYLGREVGGLEMNQAQALLGSFAIGWRGYAAILAVGLADGLVAGLVARSCAKRFLKAAY